VIHRAIFGSFERFIAILIEHYAGAFPLWLAAGAGDRAADCRSPFRVRGVGPRSARAAGLRAELDERQEKVNFKIREAQLQKIPYMLVVGDREAAEGTVAVRERSAATRARARIDLFLASAMKEIESKGKATKPDPQLARGSKTVTSCSGYARAVYAATASARGGGAPTR